MMQRRSAFRTRSCFLTVLTALIVGIVTLTSTSANAHSMSAQNALRLMDRDEFVAYTTGIVEGLIYARYVHDGRVADKGAKCIANWFYRGNSVLEMIRLAFHKFKTHTPRSIIGAMVETACPL